MSVRRLTLGTAIAALTLAFAAPSFAQATPATPATPAAPAVTAPKDAKTVNKAETQKPVTKKVHKAKAKSKKAAEAKQIKTDAPAKATAPKTN